ncbi:MAG: hypothetical protein HQK75_19245 [Candidatus Magnetomorum sp.]|nr:hypothetical protein [Candidatus Magnetomorum sp.]
MKKLLVRRFTLTGLMVLFLLTSTIPCIAHASDQKSCPPGDSNNDCKIGLEEAIIALQVIAGVTNGLTNTNVSDAKNDHSNASTSGSQTDDAQSLMSDVSGLIQLLDSIDISNDGLAGVIKTLIDDTNIPCGKVVIVHFYPFNASFQFNGSDECLGISGTVQLQSNIFDTKAYLTFDHFTFKNCTVKGDAIAAVAPENGGYKATLSSTSFSICGHELSGFLFAANNELTNKELLVGMNGSDTFAFGENQIKLEADLTYTHKGGANGMAKAIINNEPITLTFKDLIIDLEKLLPISGVIKMNGNVLDLGF